jgi:hypothetical protein
MSEENGMPEPFRGHGVIDMGIETLCAAYPFSAIREAACRRLFSPSVAGSSINQTMPYSQQKGMSIPRFRNREHAILFASSSAFEYQSYEAA